MENRPYIDRPATNPARLREGSAFLSENPEAFGYVSDAFPAVTDEWMIAAGGADRSSGGVVPTYPLPSDGLSALHDGPFSVLCAPGDTPAEAAAHAAINTIFARTFGDDEEREEHPVTRYAAALCEAVALQTLSGTQAAPEDLGDLLTVNVTHALSRLREYICRDGMTAQDPALFSVSLGACRITPAEEGRYVLDILSAGDYSVYILDADGMRPIRITHTPPLSPDGAEAPVAYRRVECFLPEPFAVLLLSESISSLTIAERRGLRDNHGLVWRYRMQLEACFLRLIADSTRAEDFGAHAERFFTGRSHGRDSASGAMQFYPRPDAFEAFRLACRNRLAVVEDMIALLPNGYDPEHIPVQPSRSETEFAFIRHLLVQDRGLVGRVSDALRLLAMERYAYLGEAREIPPPPADVPAYYRLSDEEIRLTFDRYDAENYDDRGLLAENRRALADSMSDHWITLRPFLVCRDAAYESPSVAAFRDSCDRQYDAACVLNARLGGVLTARREALSHMETLLVDSLEVLRFEGNDWLASRATTARPEAWVRDFAERWTEAARSLLGSRCDRESADAYRSLLSAYQGERDNLFARDISPDGVFSTDWRAILDGTLPAARWDAYRRGLTQSDNSPEDGGSYAELLTTLQHISNGNHVLMERIRSRAADRRMARDIAGRPDIQVAAIRASAYMDPDWGDAVCGILDTSHRNNYLTVVCEWQATRELHARQAKAYEEYRAMYEGE